jgi:hypothetical protein
VKILLIRIAATPQLSSLQQNRHDEGRGRRRKGGVVRSRRGRRGRELLASGGEGEKGRAQGELGG